MPTQNQTLEKLLGRARQHAINGFVTGVYSCLKQIKSYSEKVGLELQEEVYEHIKYIAGLNSIRSSLRATEMCLGKGLINEARAYLQGAEVIAKMRGFLDIPTEINKTKRTLSSKINLKIIP